MKTVYVVIEYMEYESEGVAGVFSTREKAEAFIKARKSALKDYLFEIEEWDIDRKENDNAHL